MRVAPSGTHRLYRQSLHSDAVLSERWSSGEYHQKSLDRNHGSIPRMGKTQVWIPLVAPRAYIPTFSGALLSGGSEAQSFRAPQHSPAVFKTLRYAPQTISPHSDPQTLVPVAEYNYLGEVVVFSERWWRMDPQRAIVDPRQLQTTQVTPALMPQHMFASDMLFAEVQLP